MKNKIDWIAVDWGTSSLRAWAMDAEGQDLDRTSSDQGMGKLTPIEFEPTLIALITPWLVNNSQTDVISCGMVGAKQGWVEAPYQSAPCLPLANLVKAPAVDPRLNVQIIGGVSQAKPADVMRGEETQIAGFQKLNPNWDGVICLPGTHTKWVQMSAGEIVSFQTFMTGELFALLSQKSVLKHSVAKMGWDKKIFKTAVNEIMSDNKLLASKLFGLRAVSILNDLSDREARSRLSGYLIGLELSGSRPYWLGQTVCILGEDEIASAYETGLRSQGVLVSRSYNKDISLDGLKYIYNLQKGMS